MRGEQDSLRMGKWMRTRGLAPEIIISSPAKRARQTVKRVCSELCPGMNNIIWDERLYLANLHELLEILGNCPDQAGSLLLVGHNPGLEDLLQYLAGSPVTQPEDGKFLPTATLAELHLVCNLYRLRAGSAHHVQITRPKSLLD
jgi:phosphohistidine phosphatase